MNTISLSGYRWKQVIANQPINKGKWACNLGCDEENHHIHKYCDWCQQRIDFYTPKEHMPLCKYGIGLGQIHPPMDPEALHGNEKGIWWSEPEEVIQSNNRFQALREARKGKRKAIDEEIQRQKEHVAQILAINERHRKELNGEGTSRVPLIEDQEKPRIGKRFRRSSY
jgi:hypothetical protein